MLNTLFLEFAAVIMIAGALALVTAKLRQPLIIAYMLTGILVGPGMFGLVQSTEIFEIMASIGIAFLLFIVGLNLNWRSVKDVGRISLATGLGQVLFTSLFGFLLGILVGFDVVTAVFLSVAFAFSSTIIIVKLLTDKEDLDRLYGRISVGMLIVQDMIAMVILLVIAAMRDGGSIGNILSVSLLKGAIVVFVLWLLARYFIPRLFRYAAKSQELLMLSALSWCFFIAGGLNVLGFGLEIGALLAGISLSGTGFQREIETKIRSLRDFFLIIFFIFLGTHLTFGIIADLAIPAIAFSAFILIGNPLIVYVIMRVMGYHSRTGFLVGLTVAQVSEFSFIVLAAGVAMEIIPASVLPLSAVVGLFTIACSSYFISYGEVVYERIAHLFPKTKMHEQEMAGGKSDEVILFGYDRMGREVLPRVQEITKRYTIVDFNPMVVENLLYEKKSAVYGDVGDDDILTFVRADHVKLVISTIPDMSVNTNILDFLKQRKSRAASVVTVKNAEDAERCYALGATFVIVPSILSGQKFGEFLRVRKTKKMAWRTLGESHVKMHQEI